MNGSVPRGQVLAITAAWIVAAFIPARIGARASDKVFKVGSIAYGMAGGASFTRGSWREELARLGYVEGRNLVVVERYAGGSVERAAEHARELVRLKVDVIMTQATPTAHAAKSVT